MERRVFLALLLCFLVLLVWARLNPPPELPAEPSGTNPVQQAAAGSAGDSGPAREGPQAAAGSGDEPQAAAELVIAEAEEELEIELGSAGAPGHYLARFTNRGARLLELRSGNFVDQPGLPEEERADRDHWVTLLAPHSELRGGRGSLELSDVNGGGPGVPLEDGLWRMEELTGADGSPSGVVFSIEPGDGLAYEKRVERVPGTFDLSVTLAVTNPAESGIQGGLRRFRFVPAGVVPVEVRDPYYVQPTAIAVGEAKKGRLELEKQARKDRRRSASGFLRAPSPLALVGVHAKYFAVLLRGATTEDERTMLTAQWLHLPPPPPASFEGAAAPGEGAAEPEEAQIAAEVELAVELPRPGDTRRHSFLLYAGPKDHDAFLASSELHDQVHESDLSWFSGIGRFLTKTLFFLQSLVGNWGVAIILLTFGIRAILFPINRRSQTAMARYQTKMKRVQPKLEEIKKKYENDPQRLRQEQARIMQEEGAFPPLGGCLPVFLQLPIFFGLFSALRTSFELRQAPFAGWITDLSQPDRLIDFGEAAPFEGLRYLNLLPILMVVLWIWQQKTMPMPTDEQARRMQRIMMFMPLVMGVFLYNYAAGLSLYMMTQSGLGIFEQKVIKKYWPVDDTEQTKKEAGGCAPLAKRMAEMAEEQQRQREQLAGAKTRKSHKPKR